MPFASEASISDLCVMKAIASELQNFIDQYLPQLHQLPEQPTAIKPAANKWSKKEILGHLIDSAQNNIRRFIVSQYEDKPKIIYNQDKWVEINHWQDYAMKDLITLWHLLNKQICFILKNTNDEVSQRLSETGSVHSIDWLATDYIKHLQHHLHQVLDLEPVAYP